MEVASDPRTDGELLVATAEDVAAFGVFYRRHVRGVLAFFRRRVCGAELALDLTAETFAAALEATPRYEPRPEPARGWLYGIAWNKLHEAQRRGQVEDRVRGELGMAPIGLSNEGLARVETLSGGAALRVLETLRADQPVDARARVVGERSSEEIAAGLRCSGCVVRKPVSRGMRAIRAKLEEINEDDPIAMLECELVCAARRRTRAQRRRALATLRPGAPTAVAAVAAVAVTGIAAAGLLLALTGRDRPAAGTTATPARAVHGSLRSTLAVLRRPRTAADRLPPRWRRDQHFGVYDPAAVRLATVTPWGERVYLVPGHDELAIVAGDGASGGGTAAGLGQGLDLQESAGRGSGAFVTALHLLVVVPDGVARVGLYLPREQESGGGPAYGAARTLMATARGNVVAFAVPRESTGTGGPFMTWYDAGGHVIKRVGSFAVATHEPTPPRPAPPTPLSRATLRDPSTPNPVVATPAVGGPGTGFTISFRILVNSADYDLRLLRHPGGPACGGSPPYQSDTPGSPTDIRGLLFDAQLVAPRGGWCPGTYRIGVAFADLGRSQPRVFHVPAPFGTATFTVRR